MNIFKFSILFILRLRSPTRIQLIPPLSFYWPCSSSWHLLNLQFARVESRHRLLCCRPALAFGFALERVAASTFGRRFAGLPASYVGRRSDREPPAVQITASFS